MKLPDRKYKIIYADPPWRYNDKSKSHGGGAESHYPCMKTEDICHLPIKDIAENDSLLFLWTTMPMLPDGLRVMDFWGFQFKTNAFTWVKINKKIRNYCAFTYDDLFMGMGHWTRGNAELCLLGTRGKPKRIDARTHSVVFATRTEHSRKPNEIRKRIVQLCGDLPRIELFARESIAGWDAWGNDL